MYSGTGNHNLLLSLGGDLGGVCVDQDVLVLGGKSGIEVSLAVKTEGLACG
jgi:hypothetical protein